MAAELPNGTVVSEGEASQRRRGSLGRLRDWAPAALLFGWFLSVALMTAPSSYAPIHVLGLAVLYALLALLLHSGALLAARLSSLLGLAAALVVGVLAVWHLREQVWVPAGRPAFGLAAAATGVLYFAACLRGRRQVGIRPVAGVLMASAALLGLSLAGFYHASNEFRWHLLRHNKLLGTPAYYVLAQPVEVLRRRLWERASPRAVASPPPPVIPAPSDGVRPNLVIVLIDTLRADSLVPWGGPPDLMPQLDRFAARNFVFEDVLSNAAWTRPSVASLFTGRLAEEHGAVDRAFGLAPDELTLAEILGASGWETAAFVTNYGAAGRDAGFDQGFDHFEQLAAASAPYARAEQVNRTVLGWLGERRGRAPLFLYVHYLDPHDPYLSGGPEMPLRYSDVRWGYQQELRYLDPHLGALLGSLEETLSEPLFILVISDHGEEFGEHAERGHGRSLYGEVLHVPALLRVPDGRSGRITARLEGRDFFRLLLRLAADPGTDVATWAAARAHSQRYASIYSTTPSSPHRPYLARVCMRGFEEGGFFAIWSAYGDTYEVYDRGSDPQEKHNLAGAEEERLRSMLSDMDDYVGPWREPTPVEQTPETEQMLRALGYLK